MGEGNGLEGLVGIMEIQRILNKELPDEVDTMDICLNCRNKATLEELEQYKGICFQCYKEQCEEFQDDAFTKDQNIVDFWGLL